MYLAYFDESGDSGVVGSPTSWFVLSCVLVHEAHWMKSLDTLVGLRSRLRERYGIGTRREIKSSDILKGRGVFWGLGLSRDTRLKIFRGFMGFQRLYLQDLATFAIAVHKTPAHSKGYNAREVAWEFALMRVDRFCQPSNERVMLFPDEGHGSFIRRLVRRKRRYGTVPSRWGTGSLRVPTERIVEDPNDRRSHDSYFVQLADWNAFAAHRSRYVDARSEVAGLWDSLGDRRLLAVNKLTGGPPGIKTYP